MATIVMAMDGTKLLSPEATREAAREAAGNADRDGYGYIPELDGVRAASILFVLAAHMLPLGPSFLQLNAASGLMGMSLFFCLSGFLITRFLHERQDLTTFMVRRLARIVPLAAVFGFVVGILIHSRWDTFAAILFFYKNYADSADVAGTGHLWSLSVEVHFYVSIGLIIALFGRRGFWLVPVAALAITGLRVYMEAHHNIRTHLRIDEILSGSLLALAWLHRDHPAAQTFIRIVRNGFWVLLVVWFLSSHEIGGPLNYLRPYAAMALIGSLLFMADGPVRRLARIGFLRYIATISYALYVWHPMTMLGWLGEGERWEKYLVKRPISFAATFALAHASTFTFERYFTRLARRLRP